jgi:hypothetical protein
MGSKSDDVFLNDTWRAFFHDPNDSDWTMQSYDSLMTVCSVKDAWLLHNTIQEVITTGMFFIMRDHVFPCWDDKHNIDGGCVSLKVAQKHTVRIFRELSQRMLGETLTDDNWDHINGISVSPKRGFNIIKLWLSGPRVFEDSSLWLPPEHAKGAMYTPFRQHIQHAHEAPTPLKT